MSGQVVEGFRLSPQQKRLWSLQQENPVYGAQCVVRLQGSLQVEGLRVALQTLVDRHEVLRTTLATLPGMAIPVQVVAEQNAFEWQFLDLTVASDQAAQVEQIRSRQGRSLSPTLQATLLQLSNTDHQLLLGLPAFCGDRASLHLLFQELAQAYQAWLEGTTLDEEPVQYLQFSEWQHELLESEEAQPGKNYWQRQTQAAGTKLRLPFECCADEAQFEPETYQVQLSGAIAAQLQTTAQRYGVTVADVLLACWQTLLWKLTGHSDLVVGTVFPGRDYEELQTTCGLLAKSLPLRSQLTSDLRFSELLHQVQTVTHEALDWQEYFAGEDALLAFGFELVTWPEAQRVELSSAPTAQLEFSLESASLCLERFTVKLTGIQQGDALSLELTYDAKRLDQGAIATLAEQLQTLIANATAQPETTIGEVSILGEAERQRLLVEWNSTSSDGQPHCIHHLFEAQVEKTPEAIALVYEAEQLTYHQLNQRANQLARVLQQQGVGPETIAGLWLERSLDLIVGLLGILKAGGAYLPLDPSWPTERVTQILQDAGAKVLVSQKALRDRLSGLSLPVVELDTEWEQIAQADSTNLSSATTPANLAYVIYTSGSTGQPKGVAVEHQQISHYTLSILEKLNLPAGSAFATVSTLAADLGNTVIFSALCTGGCLHLISALRSRDADAFADYCHQHPIDCLKIVPSHLKALLSAARPEAVLPRQRLILGGEAATWELVDQCQTLAPGCQILNHYGPTETTVGVLTYAVTSEPRPITTSVLLGRPLGQTQVYVLDEHLQPVPVGIAGELYIGGPSVSRGYLNRDALTAERFIANPFIADAGRLYRTGDRVRYLPDGNLEFLGRVDDQVKLRGFRLELGEIEAVLRQQATVREAVVILREDEPDHPRLVGYVVPASTTFEAETVRQDLSRILPDYMVPAALVPLPELPLTPNGKVDRQALPRPEQQQLQPKIFVAPRNPTEQMIAEIWAEVLGIEQVGIEDNFFALGGHSLMATQVVSRLRSAFQVEFSLQALFEAPTVAGIAPLITQQLATQTDDQLLAQMLAEIEQLSDTEAQTVLAAEQSSQGSQPTHE